MLMGLEYESVTECVFLRAEHASERERSKMMLVKVCIFRRESVRAVAPDGNSYKEAFAFLFEAHSSFSYLSLALLLPSPPSSHHKQRQHLGVVRSHTQLFVSSQVQFELHM